MKKEVVSIYVDNKANVLTRVVSLYGRRGFNIDSLTVSATNDPAISRITIVFEGDNLTLHQIVSQTEKLEVVRSIKALRDSEKAPGYARIYTPGEKAHEAQKDRLQNGIPVEANTLAEEQDADMVLTYMARMIQEAKSKGLSLRREAFQDSGRRVTLFAGVKEWFSRINAYGAGRGIRILHYINSSGLKEIIEGTEIAHEFRKIYACSFLYDVDGIAYWPAVAVNYTNKTQFIFKINKGVESVFDSKLVNRYIPENERPVPFKHMIYVGDGTTDIPCMRLVKNSGGHSIAVYNPDRKGASKEMASLIHDNRVSHVCPADYTEGSEMDILVKTIIDKIDLDDRLEKLEVVR